MAGGERNPWVAARRWRAATIVLASVLALAVVIGAVWLVVRARSSSALGQNVTIRDEHVGVELRVPDGLGVTHVDGEAERDADGCRVARYFFGDRLSIEAVAEDCEVGRDQQVMNGRHGIYRSIDDVADPENVDDVDTAVGSAKLFTQHYSESTNFTSNYKESVAIVELSHPVDPDFPSLVVRADYGHLSRDELQEIVEALEPIRSGE